mgnify:CR=1 FL=1|tara:strand:+ start:190 stop:564 length:375 start_codon:yes stop_codon:yes gene_type:complete
MYYAITPVPAPRMTKQDVWLKPRRPCVARYFAFQDHVALLKIEVSERCRIVFYMPMPKSWSKKKKELMHLQPHQQTPDGDNLEKALLDSVFRDNIKFKDDSHIWQVHREKRWSYEGGIAIETII